MSPWLSRYYRIKFLPETEVVVVVGVVVVVAKVVAAVFVCQGEIMCINFRSKWKNYLLQ